jgi:hypothetical protein
MHPLTTGHKIFTPPDSASLSETALIAVLALTAKQMGSSLITAEAAPAKPSTSTTEAALITRTELTWLLLL